MTNQEKVDAKIKELKEAVEEANGSVMVISLGEANKKNESCVISHVSGHSERLIEAVAHLLISHSEREMCSIIKKGFAIATLYKTMGVGSSDSAEVETQESNNN